MEQLVCSTTADRCGCGSTSAISRLVAAALVTLCVILTTAHAESGRDFSAMYAIGRPTVFDSTHVSVTLSLRLQNHSGASLSDAAIFLVNRAQPFKAGSLVASGIQIPDRGTAQASGAVTVSTRDYQRWQRGEPPALLVRVVNRNGRNVDHPIELLRTSHIGGRP